MDLFTLKSTIYDDNGRIIREEIQDLIPMSKDKALTMKSKFSYHKNRHISIHKV